MSRLLRTSIAAVIVTVVAVATTPTAQAAPGVTVSGTVVDGAGDPVAGITVDLRSDTDHEVVVTDVDGTYSTAPLPDGEYLVSFTDQDPMPVYPTQYWPKVWSQQLASPLVLSAQDATSVTGVDAQLTAGARVAGTITDESANPIDGACVNVLLADGDDSWVLNTAAAADGTYLTPLVPADLVVVEFVDCMVPLTFLSARSATLTLSEGEVRTGVDGQLELGAAISGTVRDEQGDPIQNICVTERHDGADGPEWGNTETSAADGTFTIAPLVAGEYWLELAPCGDEPFEDRELGPFVVAASQQLTGVDVALVEAATFAGTVRDADGDPLAGICVQASDADHVAGSDETANDGTYSVLVDRPGSFDVQFVDCGDTPGVGSFDTTVTLAEAQHVTGVDATLAAAAPASVEGTVTNVRGEPIEGLCVVAYLPFETVHAAGTDADGTFELPELGPGRWAIAFLECQQGDGPDVDPSVPDPDTGIRWQPLWWRTAPLDLSGSDPDPIVQGAAQVTLGPGATVRLDQCFGCEAIDASVVLDDDVVRAQFDASGIVDPTAATSDPTAAADVRAAAADVRYTLMCVSDTGATSQAAGAASPLEVDGLEPGTPYSCAVGASVDDLVVGRSVAAEVGGTSAAPTGSATTPGGGTGASGAGAPLAFVG